MKKIVYLLLLGLAGCQQEGVITEVPKDDWSVVANTAGQVKGQVNIKFKELPEDLQIVTTRSGVDTDNGQLNFVIRQLGGTRGAGIPPCREVRKHVPGRQAFICGIRCLSTRISLRQRQ